MVFRGPRRSLAAGILAGVSVLATSVAVQAQTGAAQSAGATASSAAGNDDIIVTALKRATSIQQTPLAISAVNAETLARQNITDSAALSRVSPGLQVNESANGGTRVIIRNLYATGEALVGIYYDEVPLSGTGGVSNDAGGTQPSLRMFDVERAEVLRGPQGTLYGASSMGGTMRIIFNKPKLDVYEGAVDGQLNTSAESGGSLGRQVNAMVNVPVIDGVLGVRAVGFFDRSAGFIDNSLLGRDNFNSNRGYGGRLTVRFEPTSDITLDLMAVYQDREGSRSDWNYTEYQLTGKKYNQPLLLRQPQHDRMKLFSGTLNWDLDFATLTATASYSDRFLKYIFDYTPYFARFQSVNHTRGLVPEYAGDPTKIPGYKTFVGDCNSGIVVGTSCDGAGYQKLVNGYGNSTTFQPQSNKTSTQEIRLADDQYDIKWTVGLYHSYRKNFTQSILSPADPFTGIQYYPNGYPAGNVYTVGVDNVGLDRLIDDRLEQFAAFADITWDITDKLSVNGGIRYFKYKKKTTSTVIIPSYIAGNSIQPPLTSHGDEKGTLLKFSANYQFNPDVMFYATATQGYRPGGVNQTLGLPSYAAIYSADKVWNYEAGVKSSWLDRMLVLNVNGFRMDWTNMQVSASYNNAFGFITNSSSPARIQGIEFDTALFPADRLSLRLSGSYIDAKLKGDQSLPNGITPCPVPFVPGTTGCATIAAGKAGDPIPYSPKWTLQASADYVMPVGNDLEIVYHGNLSYRSSSLTTYNLPRYAAAYPNGPAGTPGGDALYTLPGYATVGLRLGLEKEGGRWGAYLFANNLFNTIGLSSLVNGQASATQLGWSYNGAILRPNYVISTAPRTVGVQFMAKFH